MWTYVNSFASHLNISTQRCWPFRENYGLVFNEGRFFFVDKQLKCFGRELELSEAESFDSQYTIGAPSIRKWGIIDSRFRWCTAQIYWSITHPSKGFATAKIGSKAYIIKLSEAEGGMETRIDVDFVSLSGFSHGFCIGRKNGSYSYLNECGERRFGSFIGAEMFSEGLSIVQHQDPKLAYGALNTDGEIVFSGMDYLAPRMSEGRIAFSTGREYGYCNATGEVVIEPAYELASPFFCGMAVVSSDDSSWLIDRNGKDITNERFADVVIVSECYCAVKKSSDSKFEIIDMRNGMVVCEQLKSVESSGEFPFAAEL